MMWDVYEYLYSIGQCGSTSEFSRKWLAREGSYLRSLKSKGRSPSLDVYVELIAKLRLVGTALLGHNVEEIREMGATMHELAEKCIQHMLKSASGEWWCRE